MFDDIDPGHCDRLDRSRGRWAAALNLLAPGSGLIILRQDRRGLKVAGVFAGLALPGLWGVWILPGILPTGVALGCLILAAALWLFSQVWVWRRRAAVLGECGRAHIRACCSEACDAANDRQFAQSEAILRTALQANDEDPAVWAQWARLLVVMGRIEPARQAWEAALDVDKTGTFRREGIIALERLPVTSSERAKAAARSSAEASRQQA